MGDKKDLFWADQIADRVVERRGAKESYIVASRISPSGTIHIGNFREPMTGHLIKLALENKDHQVKHFHSWDNYDRFRKVPSNVSSDWEQYIGMPLSKVPDPESCHESYARHFEAPFEEDMKKVGVEPIIISETERYTSGEYADDIRHALRSREALRAIFDGHRTEPLGPDWFPLIIYCEKCGKDFTSVESYDEEFTVKYNCKCGHSNSINFKENHIVKLPWRIDWPMRWNHDGVDFEAAGKEHMTKGGSRTTGNEIMETVLKGVPPVEKKYEFIILKGAGGKMSGSKGNVIALGDVLKIYVPEVARFLFAGSRPETEFFVSFELDVLQVYDNFDRLERMYYEADDAKSEKDASNKRRIYELSRPVRQDSVPFQPTFRHLTTVLQMFEFDLDQTNNYFQDSLKTFYDKDRLNLRIAAAKYWLENYAPEDLKFQVQDTIPDVELSDKQRAAIKELTKLLQKQDWSEEDLSNELYEIAKRHDLPAKEFFQGAYRVLLNKDRGPKLGPFLVMLEERAQKLLEQF